MTDYKAVFSGLELSRRIADCLEASAPRGYTPDERPRAICGLNDILQGRSSRPVDELLAELDKCGDTRLPAILADVRAFLRQKELLTVPYGKRPSRKRFTFKWMNGAEGRRLKIINQELYDRAAREGFPANFFREASFDHVTFFCLPDKVDFCGSELHDVYERYAHTDLLEGRLPIYLMNTVGDDHACVLLKDGRCSAYEGRPSVCRIYPLSVRLGQRGKPFEYYCCVDQHAAHFSDGKMQVKDWLHENFSRESREFWAAEGSALPTLGCLLNKLDAGKLRASLFQILYYRYYNYDLDLPFMPQYQKNMAALVHFLQQRLGEV